MIRPPVPGDEDARLKALRRYAMRDRSPDPVLDQITAMIAELFDVPYVLVSLVDEGCQWFKSHHGIDVEETPREISFCAHALQFHPTSAV
ncbi:hypothetical protein [Halomonas sp.]|uniref:hypothetical protein n=1 Tax=Halomonas sp. TaxID=1486246 RepID=UPI00384F9C4B